MPAPVKPATTIDVLDQIDIRIGTITRVEDVPASKKLARLSVDFGDHTRTILAGLKHERADVREIEGKQALFVVNLPPREMALRRSHEASRPLFGSVVVVFEARQHL